MPIYAISIDIGPGDHRPVRSLLSRFHNEVRRGRRPGQISLNGSFVLVHTPEMADVLMARILAVSGLNTEFDRVSIIDMTTRRILNWGKYDSCMVNFFPLIALDYKQSP